MVFLSLCKVLQLSHIRVLLWFPPCLLTIFLPTVIIFNSDHNIECKQSVHLMDKVHFYLYCAKAWQVHKSLYIWIWNVINGPHCWEQWKTYVRITQLSDMRRLVGWFMEAPISIYLKSETWKRLVLISPSGLGPMQAVISQVQPKQSLLSPLIARPASLRMQRAKDYLFPELPLITDFERHAFISQHVGRTTQS